MAANKKNMDSFHTKEINYGDMLVFGNSDKQAVNTSGQMLP